MCPVKRIFPFSDQTQKIIDNRERPHMHPLIFHAASLNMVLINRAFLVLALVMPLPSKYFSSCPAVDSLRRSVS